MYYVYMNHVTGNTFVEPNEIEDEYLYCETCGDSDRLLETFGSEEEATEYARKFNSVEVE